MQDRPCSNEKGWQQLSKENGREYGLALAEAILKCIGGQLIAIETVGESSEPSACVKIKGQVALGAGWALGHDAIQECIISLGVMGMGLLVLASKGLKVGGDIKGGARQE